MIVPIENEKLKHELKHQLEDWYPNADIKVENLDLTGADNIMSPDFRSTFYLKFNASFHEKVREIKIDNLRLKPDALDKFKSADQTKNGYKELSTQIADVLEDYYGHD